MLYIKDIQKIFHTKLMHSPLVEVTKYWKNKIKNLLISIFNFPPFDLSSLFPAKQNAKVLIQFKVILTKLILP